MWKLSNKTKVNFVKAYILFCFAWMILFIYVCFCYETGIHPEWKVACLVIFVLYVFFIIIMLYLMSVVNIVPLKVKPKIKKIGVNEFEELKKYILQGADKYGFQEVQIAGGDQLNMSLALKNDKDATYVLHLVWMDNFDEEKVMRATAICWENIEKWVGTKMMFQPIALMQCVCVQRMNNSFKKYITQNVQQAYKRYQLHCAVSLGGKNAYICQTKGGFLRSYYRYLDKLFGKITSEVFIDVTNSAKES